MIEILIPDENDSIISVNLESKAYSLHFKWNSAGEFWSFGITDDNENVIVESIKIVPSYPLTEIFKNPSFPPGEFIAVSDDSNTKLQRESFIDGSASFVYIEESELNAIFESS